MQHKKFLSTVLALLLMCTCLSGIVSAQNPSKELTVCVFGQVTAFDSKPFVENEIVWVPVEESIQKMGGSTEYDPNTGILSFSIGVNQFTVTAQSTHASYNKYNNRFSNYDYSERELKNATKLKDGFIYATLDDLTDLTDILFSLNPAENKVNIGMYTVVQNGEREGWSLLKGHPLEHRYSIYFQKDKDGEYQGTSFKYEEINPLSLSDKITYQMNGVTYTTTRGDAYEYFKAYDKFYLAFNLPMDKYNSKMKELKQIFGSCYDAWEQGTYEYHIMGKYYPQYENQEKIRTGTVNKTSPAPDPGTQVGDVMLMGDPDEPQESKLIKEHIESLMKQTIDEYTRALEENGDKINSEWVTEEELRSIADVSLAPSVEQSRTWDLYQDYSPIFSFTMTEEEYKEAASGAVDVGGIQVKRKGIRFLFLTSDLVDMGILSEEDIGEESLDYDEFCQSRVDAYMELNGIGYDGTYYYYK